MQVMSVGASASSHGAAGTGTHEKEKERDRKRNLARRKADELRELRAYKETAGAEIDALRRELDVSNYEKFLLTCSADADAEEQEFVRRLIDVMPECGFFLRL